MAVQTVYVDDPQNPGERLAIRVDESIMLQANANPQTVRDHIAYAIATAVAEKQQAQTEEFTGAMQDWDTSREAFELEPYGEGAVRRQIGGTEMIGYPEENVWARPAIEGGTSPEVIGQGLQRRRGIVARDGGEDPFMTSIADGFFWNAGDEVMEMADPVAAEAMRQTLDQYQIDSPLGYLGGQVIGGLGSGATAGRAIASAGGAIARGVQNVGNWLRSGSMLSRGARGAATGIPAAIGQAALSARPGERWDAASDPFNIALGAGLGGAVGAWSRPVPGQVVEIDTPSRRLIENYIEQPQALPYGLGVGEAPSSGAASAAADIPLRTMSPQEGAAVAAQRADFDVPYGIVTGDRRFGSQSGLLVDIPLRRATDRFNSDIANAFAGRVREIGSPAVNPQAAATRLGDAANARSREIRDYIGDVYANFMDSIDSRSPFEFDQEVREAAQRAIDERWRAGAVRTVGGQQVGSNTGIREAEALLQRGNASFEGLLDARTRIDTYLQNHPNPNDVMYKTAKSYRDAVTMGLEDIISRSSDDPDAAIRTWHQIENSARANAADNAATRDLSIGAQNAYNQIVNGISAGGQRSAEQITRLRELGGSAYDDAVARAVYDMGFTSGGRNGVDQFDYGQFASNWNSIPDNTKRAMFDASHVQALDDIATIGARAAEVMQGGRNLTAGSAVTDWDNILAVVLPSAGGTPGAGVAVAQQAIQYFRNRNLANPTTAKQFAKLLRDLQNAGDGPGRMQRILDATAPYIRPATAVGVGAGYGAGAYGLADALTEEPAE